MKLNVNNYLVARIIAHGIISGLLKLTQRQWRAKSRSYIIFGDSFFMYCNCPTQDNGAQEVQPSTGSTDATIRYSALCQLYTSRLLPK